MDKGNKIQQQSVPPRVAAGPGGRVKKLVDLLQLKINVINFLTIAKISEMFMTTNSRYCTYVSPYELQK